MKLPISHLCLLALPLLLVHDVTALPTTPHIIFIVADDLGHNDVEWNNPDMSTPYMKTLAEEGIILDNNYVYPLCTPSRVAFMTGRYPHKVGLQHKTIKATQPNYVPLQYDLLPKKLKEQGYHTHMIGKWHLGYCDAKVTPQERGFDSFFGFYNGGEDYYSQHVGAYKDFRKDAVRYDPDSDGYNDYSTIAYAERAIEIIEDHKQTKPDEPMFLYISFQAPHYPMQVPDLYKNHFDPLVITDDTRRTFSGMVKAMDTAIGLIVNKLENTGFIDKAVIAFTSDNGGLPNNGGNNYPLRGTKGTFFEGGTRVPGFVYSKTELTQKKYRSDKIFHATDWYATFFNLAGGNSGALTIDGLDQWSTLSSNGNAARTGYPINNDEIGNFHGYREGKFKLMLGNPGNRDDVYDVPVKRSLRAKRQRSHTYLYDLDDNPDEDPAKNLYSDPNYKTDLRTLRSLLNTAKGEMVTAIYPAEDTAAAEAAAQADGNYWAPGWCTAV